ncbi:MAG: zinc metallopeptidase [Lachnospiraceae bacterium]|nr:zinc metallopeptidase [Lachnospiraceae bacterium]
MLLLTNGYYFGGRSYGYGLRFDKSYFLVLAGMLICMAAHAYLQSVYKKYASIPTSTGMTGREAAMRVLYSQGVSLQINHVAGSLTDHYDPSKKTVNLSDSVYDRSNVAAVCIAAHECGHAMQDQEHYAPLALRTKLVPVANLGSQISIPVFIAGMIFSIPPLLTVGIVLFTAAVLFQLVTLPVEFNASRRALRILEDNALLPQEELRGGRIVLRAAALTYVAGFLQTVLQMARLILLARRRRD